MKKQTSDEGKSRLGMWIMVALMFVAGVKLVVTGRAHFKVFAVDGPFVVIGGGVLVFASVWLIIRERLQLRRVSQEPIQTTRDNARDVT